MDKDLVQKFETEEQDVLTERLKVFSDAYYNGIPLISDDDFDLFLKIYEKRFGRWRQIRASPSEVSREKVPLPFYVGSLDKIKLELDDQGEVAKAIERFNLKYGPPYTVSDKIDGLSVLYTGDALYSTGNGYVGLDVSHLLPYLSLPETHGMTIRGEMVMTRDNFRQWQEIRPDAKNPRNSSSGLVNSKTIDLAEAKGLKLLSFYALDVMGEIEATPFEKFEWLKEAEFKVPWNEVITHINVDILTSILHQRKMLAPYEIDGIVVNQEAINSPVTVDNPPYAFAFKVQSGGVVTTVISVVWKSSKDMRLKPVVIFRPVEIEGTTVQRATGNNAKFILQNGIGPGSVVKIVKSGEIIPKISEVIAKTEAQLPDLDPADYDWDTTQTDFVLKKSNLEVEARKIEYFAKKLGIKGLGPARAKQLVSHGFDTPQRIIQSTVRDLEFLGPTIAKTLYDNVHRAITRVPLALLMAASGIFGRGMGSRRAQLVIDVYPDILDLPEEEIVNDLLEIEGFGEITASQFSVSLPEFKEWLRQIPEITYSLERIDSVSSSGASSIPSSPAAAPALSGKIIIMTGFRSQEFEHRVQRLGGRATENPPTKRDAANSILVSADAKDSSKKKKAIELNIPVMSREDFERRFF